MRKNYTHSYNYKCPFEDLFTETDLDKCNHLCLIHETVYKDIAFS